MKKQPAINDLLSVMARLRSPTGCPWDREQSHMTLRRHAIEEVYELIDAIEAGDDHEMAEELGDLLLQVVFHCQLARERGAFDFEKVCRLLVDKLIRRHPHVFGKTKVKDVDEVWANWEKIKRAEKHGTRHARHSAFDGIPETPARAAARRKTGEEGAQGGSVDKGYDARSRRTARSIKAGKRVASGLFALTKSPRPRLVGGRIFLATKPNTGTANSGGTKPDCTNLNNRVSDTKSSRRGTARSHFPHHAVPEAALQP